MNVAVVLVAISLIPMLQGDLLGPDWERNLQRKVEKRMIQADGPFDANWSHNLRKRSEDSTEPRLSLGNNTLSAVINGKNYTAKLEKINSINGLNTTTKDINGQKAEIVTVSINGDTSIYTTINNVTTVTDAKGNLRHDGGIFHMKSSSGYVDGYVNGRSVHYDYAFLPMMYFLMWFFDVLVFE